MTKRPVRNTTPMTVHLTPKQRKFLLSLAKQEEISQSKAIRRLLDSCILAVGTC